MLRFGTAGIRGPVSEVITPEAIVTLSRAIAAEGDDFVVARDGRKTGPALLDAAVAGLVSGGARVERLGVLPTPALAFASQDRYGLMITASHNPPTDNGVKVFANGREINRTAEQRIEERLDQGEPVERWNAWGTVRHGDVLSAYQQAVQSFLDPIGSSPTELTVVLDTGSGTASLIAPTILRQLGATVRTLNAPIDGTFPARQSKPTPASVKTLRAFVADGPADLGIAFDGDADRIVVVDSDGSIVHEDTVLAIVAEWAVRNAHVDDPVVVTTPNASTRIDDRVRAAGGRVERTPLGELRRGIERVNESGDNATQVVFAGEPWKHLHPSFGPWIDGIVSGGLLVKLLAEQELSERRRSILELPYRKGSVECRDVIKEAVMEAIEPRLASRYPEAAIDTAYGVKLVFENMGWILVRPSGTEPKLRIYVESEEAAALLDDVETLLGEVLTELQ